MGRRAEQSGILCSIQYYYYYHYYYYYYYYANGFITGGSKLQYNTIQHTSHKITHNTQDNSPCAKLQQKSVTHTIKTQKRVEPELDKSVLKKPVGTPVSQYTALYHTALNTMQYDF